MYGNRSGRRREKREKRDEFLAEKRNRDLVGTGREKRGISGRKGRRGRKKGGKGWKSWIIKIVSNLIERTFEIRRTLG